MIFGAGLFLFVVSYALSVMKRPSKPGAIISAFGLFGCLLMLASFCMLLAKVMP